MSSESKWAIHPASLKIFASLTNDFSAEHKIIFIVAGRSNKAPRPFVL